MDLLSTLLRMNLTCFLMQWFLIGTLDAMARRCSGGLIVVMSPNNTGRATTGLTFLLR